MIPDILTIQQLATYLQLPKNLVRQKVQAGEIPAAKIGKEWRVRRSLIDQWLDDQARLAPQTFDQMVAEARQGMRRAGVRTQADAERFLAQVRAGRRARGKR
jgi:excisionase family DNA binding protein